MHVPNSTFSHCDHDRHEACLLPARPEDGCRRRRAQVRLAHRAEAQALPPPRIESGRCLHDQTQRDWLPDGIDRQEFELPHKRAVYFVLRRHRFFQAATLY